MRVGCRHTGLRLRLRSKMHDDKAAHPSPAVSDVTLPLLATASPRLCGGIPDFGADSWARAWLGVWATVTWEGCWGWGACCCCCWCFFLEKKDILLGPVVVVLSVLRDLRDEAKNGIVDDEVVDFDRKCAHALSHNNICLYLYAILQVAPATIYQPFQVIIFESSPASTSLWSRLRCASTRSRLGNRRLHAPSAHMKIGVLHNYETQPNN